MSVQKKKKKNKKILPKLQNYNCKYYCDYVYNEETNCYEYGCDSICRCSRIVDFKFNSVDVHGILVTCLKFHKMKLVDQYCIDRLCRIYGIEDTDNYYVNIQHSYYGEEVMSITLDSHIAWDLDNDIAQVLKLKTNAEKIKFVLEKEYGYLLDEIAQKSRFRAKKVARASISFNQRYFKGLDEKLVNSYHEYDLPVAICIRDGSRYRLVDGHHRLAASKDKQVTIFC